MTLKKFNVQKYKITIPISNILIIWTPIFEWFMVRSVSKNGHQKDRPVSKRDWTTCYVYANHSIHKNQHDWGYTHDYLMRTQIFFLIMNSIKYDENDYGQDLD